MGRDNGREDEAAAGAWEIRVNTDPQSRRVSCLEPPPSPCEMYWAELKLTGALNAGKRYFLALSYCDRDSLKGFPWFNLCISNIAPADGFILDSDQYTRSGLR